MADPDSRRNRPTRSPGDALRPARPGDAGRLAELCGQLGYPSSPQSLRRRLSGILPDEDQAVYVAQGPDGDVVGWVHVALRPLLLAGPQAEIRGLVVDQAHRRRGLGRLLMERAERWARDRGCLAVHLRSNVDREETPFFYEGIGYTQAETSRTFCRELG
jgi:GNAT superfamily N-acetyltransferase